MSTADHEGSLSKIVEAFVIRHDRGDLTSLSEFIAEQPEALRGDVRERCESILNLLRLMPTPGAESEGWRDPVNKRVGDFRIIEELGRGGMGVVYLAEQLSLQRKVALKVLPHHLTLSQRHVRRFQNEAEAAAKLEYPGIVRVHAIGQEAGVWYIAMEYVEGRSLYQELQDAQTAPENGARETAVPARADKNRAVKIAALVADIADALHFAHKRGVIHRDIKPHNILIDRDGNPRIVDFGLAKIIDVESISRLGDLAGTPCYMSPEQALANRVPVDHRTDVFSLGVVLYEMLTLQRPFGGTTSEKVLYEITFLDPTPVRSVDPRLPDEIDAICTRALEKNPDHRFPTAEELALDLRRFVADEPILTKRLSLPKKLWRGLVRRRGIATAAVLIVVALFVGGMINWERVETTPVTIRAPGHPGARVSYEVIDMTTGRVSAPVYVGLAPVESIALELKYYRFIIEVQGVGFAEMSRLLYKRQEPLVVEARVRSTSEVTNKGMVLVPGGTFIFGGPGLKPLFNHHEHEEKVDAFWIDEAEVSNGEYELFVNEGGGRRPEYWPERSLTPEEKLLPVTGMGYEGAKAYAEWVGKRLPTELEWERAACGKEGWSLPWKEVREPDEVFDGFANVDMPFPRADRLTKENAWPEYVKVTVPVRSMEHGMKGKLYHLLGNAREWTDSVICQIQGDGDPVPSLSFRAAKGGAWDESPVTRELHYVRAVPIGGPWHLHIGIRCAKSVRPEHQPKSKKE